MDSKPAQCIILQGTIENAWASFFSINYIQYEAVFENNTSMLTSIIPLQHLGTVSLATKCVSSAPASFSLLGTNGSWGKNLMPAMIVCGLSGAVPPEGWQKATNMPCLGVWYLERERPSWGKAQFPHLPLLCSFFHMWKSTAQWPAEIQNQVLYIFFQKKTKRSVLIGNVSHSTARLDLVRTNPPWNLC